MQSPLENCLCSNAETNLSLIVWSPDFEHPSVLLFFSRNKIIEMNSLRWYLRNSWRDIYAFYHLLLSFTIYFLSFTVLSFTSCHFTIYHLPFTVYNLLFNFLRFKFYYLPPPIYFYLYYVLPFTTFNSIFAILVWLFTISIFFIPFTHLQLNITIYRLGFIIYYFQSSFIFCLLFTASILILQFIISDYYLPLPFYFLLLLHTFNNIRFFYCYCILFPRENIYMNNYFNPYEIINSN